MNQHTHVPDEHIQWIGDQVTDYQPIEEPAMEIVAHATTFEFATGIVVFLAGMCVGPILAYLLHARSRTRRD